MSKKNVQSVEEQAAPVQETKPAVNHTLTYRREHPQNRCSYGVTGVSGIVVFDRNLFADPAYTGPITVDCALAQPKEDKKVARATAQAAKLQERATKAQERIAQQEAKAKERAAKAQEALDKAKARLAAAQAPATTA